MKKENPEDLINNFKEYARKNGFRLNSNPKTVATIINGLLAKEVKYGKKYCPCRSVSGDKKEDDKIICPCAYHKKELLEGGKCFCGLFVK